MAEQAKLTVTDIKQYSYCPRMIFYTYCQPVYKKTTFKMECGQEEHKRLENLEIRRTFKKYDIDNAERLLRVKLISERLGISGILDMALKSAEEIIPVEFKYTTNVPGLNHKYQLTAYALMLEEQYNVAIKRGMIYLIPENKVVHVQISEELRQGTVKIIQEIKKIIASEKFPDGVNVRNRCRDCEYVNYCGDV